MTNEMYESAIRNKVRYLMVDIEEMRDYINTSNYKTQEWHTAEISLVVAVEKCNAALAKDEMIRRNQHELR